MYAKHVQQFFWRRRRGGGEGELCVHLEVHIGEKIEAQTS